MPSILMKGIPDDVKKYIVKIQGEIKNTKGISQFSQQATIMHIIREHKKMKEKK